jgi:hypothetical protein
MQNIHQTTLFFLLRGYHLLENSINRLVNLQNLLSTQEHIRIDLHML